MSCWFLVSLPSLLTHTIKDKYFSFAMGETKIVENHIIKKLIFSSTPSPTITTIKLDGSANYAFGRIIYNFGLQVKVMKITWSKTI